MPDELLASWLEVQLRKYLTPTSDPVAVSRLAVLLRLVQPREHASLEISSVLVRLSRRYYLIECGVALGRVATTECLNEIDKLLEAGESSCEVKMGLAGVHQQVELRATTVDDLVALSESQDPEVRWNVMIALGMAGPYERFVVPSVMSALHDTDEKVRYYAIETSTHFREPNANLDERLGELESDPSARVRSAAENALQMRSGR